MHIFNEFDLNNIFSGSVQFNSIYLCICDALTSNGAVASPLILRQDNVVDRVISSLQFIGPVCCSICVIEALTISMCIFVTNGN